MTSSEASSAEGSRVARFAFEQLESQIVDSFTPPGDILAAVQLEAERIREQARLEGEREGRAAAEALVRSELETAVHAAGAAYAALRELELALVESSEAALVDLALRLAEQIVAGVLEAQPERVLDVARTALRRLLDRRRVTLVVNPLDLELVSSSISEVVAELGGIDQLDVQADRRVGRGGAIARTQVGEVDATIETQLARAREIAAAAVRADHPPEVADGRAGAGLA